MTMSVKKYKICDNQEYSRTPTPPSFARSNSLVRPKSLVRISLSSSPSNLLIKPGSIDIFNTSVIPAISKYEIPPEPREGLRIAVKLPCGQRLCRRFTKTTRVGSLHSWIKSELTQRDENKMDAKDNLKNSERFVLKLVEPPCINKTLEDENSTLSDYEILSDTLLVLEND